MPRVEVVSDEENPEAQDVPVDDVGSDDDDDADEPREERRKRRRKDAPPEVEIEREVTKRRLIESVTQIVVVVLYMAFTLLRDRDAGVVVLDDEGPEDDWAE